MVVQLTVYRVEVADRLPASARSWFGDLGVAEIERTDATSTLTVHDQAALVGLVNRIHGLGIVILSVTRPSRTVTRSVSER
jgi:hypothetical protein